MNRACIVLIVICLAASHLPAQNAYKPNYDELYNIKTFANYAASMDRHASPQPIVTGTTPPPPPAAVPVRSDYNWPGPVDTSATFSIVTASGAEYLATMVWVEGENIHFNSVDGGVRQIPLSSVSRSLTQTANAQKNLNLSLPLAPARPASVATSN